MKPYEVFAARFGSQVVFHSEMIVEKDQRYYSVKSTAQKAAAKRLLLCWVIPWQIKEWHVLSKL